MGMATIAEFVENAEVLKLLKNAGVDYVQGYYIGRPAGSMMTKKGQIKAAG